MFISFEGVDGSGKTTQARLLAEALRAEGRDVVDTREPGGTPLGERVRELLLSGEAVTPWAETALFAAARAQLVDEVIRPALSRGAGVVCDRYIDSSLAYQGLARGLGVERVLELNLLATGGLLPDRTFLLLLPPEEAAQRQDEEPDRIERGRVIRLARRRRLPRARASSPNVSLPSTRRRSPRPCRDDPWTASRPFLSRRRRRRFCGRRLPRAPRTRTSSMARAASASGGPRSPLPGCCSAMSTGSRAARIQTSTSSSRSATRSGSIPSVRSVATCTCGRSRPTGASTSCSAPTS